MMEKPAKTEMVALLGEETSEIWKKLCASIEGRYDMSAVWKDGGKAWKYECKYGRGGKTLCGLYARENAAGFMIIFGAAEREKVERIGRELGEKTVGVYEQAKIYRDGKWVMFPLDEELIPDFMKLLEIKRKPDRQS